MKRENSHMIKIMMMISLFLLFIFFSVSVQAMEQSQKEELGLQDNPLYTYYQTLSEEEKQQFKVAPSPYLLDNTLIINSEGIKVEKEQDTLFRTRELIPIQYRLTDEIIIPAKNQKNLGLCWAFTALRALETNLAIKGKGYYDFSELHLDYMTSTLYGGDRKLHDGGNFNNFATYVKNGLGPILEESLPLKTDITSSNEEESAQIIQETKDKIKKQGLDKGNVTPVSTNIVARFFESFDKEAHSEAELVAFQNKMKSYIQKNGALDAGLFFDSFSDCYNSETKSFLSPRVSNPKEGHGVNIIGWDDNFSKDNFAAKYPAGQNGAWIVSNSWGEEWGENGYFYISYEDNSIYRHLKGIDSAEIVMNEPDISIVNVSSKWEADWKNQKQTILITGVSKNTIQSIKVNGVTQKIENNTATYEITQSGTYEIEVKDSKGKVANKQYVVQKLDVEKPTIKISSNVNIPSCQDIVLTVDVTDTGGSQLTDYLLVRRSTDPKGKWYKAKENSRYQDSGNLFWSEGFQVQKEGNQIIAKTKYVAEKEGSFILYVKAVDKAGNESAQKAITVTFDKTAPELKVNYSTEQEGVVTIQANEKLQPVPGWILSQDKLSLTKKYLQTTQEEITIKDLAGNSQKLTIDITIKNNVILGDINGDNLLNMTDVLIVLRHIASVKQESIKEKHPDWYQPPEKLVKVDVNEDGMVNLVDVLRLERHIVANKSEEIKQKHPDWILTK